MQFGIYAPDPISGAPLALRDALKAAGHPAFVLNGGAFTPPCFRRQFGAVFVEGCRHAYGDAVRTYVDRHTPTFVTDLAPIGRGDGYVQVGEMGLNGLVPEGPDVPDRIGLLRLVPDAKTKVASDKGPFVILSQKPGDGQHGMSANQLQAYFDEVVEGVRLVVPDARFIFREHPRDQFQSEHVLPPDGCEWQTESVRAMPIDQALRSLRPRAVFTFNSTAAIAAILLRIPVFSNASAFYADLSEDDLKMAEDPSSALPSIGRIEVFLRRLSWLIWKPEEFAGPDFIPHILRRCEAINEQFLGDKQQRAAREEARVRSELKQQVRRRKVRRGFMKTRAIR